MCGIAGIYGQGRLDQRIDCIGRMLSVLRHRGPDQAGILLDNSIALGHVRLSILDVDKGKQPIGNEDGTIWIVYNGEVYNDTPLRADLVNRGHRFQTHTDTEVLVHLYEEYGTGFLQHLNGQFAFALWDCRTGLLMLARDRLGVRPLYYSLANGRLVFGSEIKAIIASGIISAELDPIALDQSFTFWSTLSPCTPFRDIFDVPPGEYLQFHDGHISYAKYWQLEFPPTAQSPPVRRIDEYQDELEDLLIDATRIRLRADVPVGSYLSGGLDSSLITTLVQRGANTPVDTFSIAFEDATYDEAVHQQRMASYLGTKHHCVRVTNADIGRVFPDVVWHAEMPLLRTSPAPMYLLSELVRENGYKVVLTGEGADEFLAGYNIFKEDKIRRFWARQPDSTLRPLLFQRLYPYIKELNRVGETTLTTFFGQGYLNTDAPNYSHQVRWRNTSRTKRFFSRELSAQLNEHYGADHHPDDDIAYPPEFMALSALSRAQYLEISIFLPQYLLSAQGDRVGMAHSVEGRFPFLDHRVVEFCNALPPWLKMRGLNEKYLLRKVGESWLPKDICWRTKQAYRAPIHSVFFGPGSLPYVRELLSESYIRSTGLFNPSSVSQLVAKIERGVPISETDNMALAGILSTQLLYRQFVEMFQMPQPMTLWDKVVTIFTPLTTTLPV